MKIKKLLFSRMVIVGFAILVQVVWVVNVILKLTEYSIWVDFALTALSILALLVVINKRENPAYKLAWTVPILVFPLLGGILYLLLGNKRPSAKMRAKIDKMMKKARPYIIQDESIMEEIAKRDPKVKNQVQYLIDYADAPIYKNTKATYFKSGEENFPYMLEALRSAKHFIFMEYFIIDEGRMWGEILEILKQKAAEGLDVRLMYDDVGCATMLPYNYHNIIEGYGIKCEAFNHMVPIYSAVMNNRDHRKILVIDGHTGFTGGINLADEYINEKERFGYWKDTGIMLKGDAVWGLTTMFLTMWNAFRPMDENFEAYRPHTHYEGTFETDGYIQPYGDSPLDGETVGENVYLNIINGAEHYVYIFTPYLIIDNEMMTALCLAAKRGVDVRIVTPNIPDKKLVFWLTQSYYGQLADAGVKVYQFTPGFIHAKCFVCDDKVATVGTINMDYRSLYLHFECGVFLYDSSEVMKVKEDAQETIARSHLMNGEVINKSFVVRLTQAILRLFAPLL